jgi:hypothetical protein
VDGREQLTIAFPQYGAIEVDPAVNVVRSIEAALGCCSPAYHHLYLRPCMDASSTTHACMRGVCVDGMVRSTTQSVQSVPIIC